ncbi:hypothetical protein [Peptoniphilus porci]|uniref:Uncharacterized protein n=1 Tax=Peptoniphilus porci TaxID=2652280 RepID=A0A1U7LZT7_9FIRM|nr:hypothetical protein [Peptoniphilus porci]OLR64942.1 hypothetical protein BIV18_05155 [Peptoniphilus porci]
MSDKRFKRVLILIFVIFLGLIPVLFLFSDNREQSVKEVENEFKIKFPPSVKRIRELKKEPSFHGDGEAAILFSVDKNDIDKIKSELKDCKVEGEVEKIDAIETCYNSVKRRGFDTSIDLSNEKYFKSTNNTNPYGNYIALVIDNEKCEILFLKGDT